MRNAAGEEFGKQRLRDIIRANAKKSASDIVSAIAQRLSEFRGATRQTDDLTFVILRYLGNSKP